MDRNEVSDICKKFEIEGELVDVDHCTTGLINHTYFISTQENTSGDVKNANKYVVQKINKSIFVSPELNIANIRQYIDHLANLKNQNELISTFEAWQIPQLIKTKDEGKDYFVDMQGDYWRMMSFIENAESFESTPDLHYAYQVGAALGKFHSLVFTMDAKQFHDTLRNFHVTPKYLEQYDLVAKKNLTKKSNIDYCHNFIDQRRDLAHILENAKEQNLLTTCIIHGDPKVSNILFDKNSKLATAFIDLDTIKHNLIHYDLGDCLRSACNPTKEDASSLHKVQFNLELFEQILDGYLSHVNFLTKVDFEYIFDATRLIAFELGIRFFTDYLNGNVYFAIGDNEEQNLNRALVQFKLVESLENQKDKFEQIVLSRANP
ncbi:MAG: aminoglycoside phosphotransferase family protein [Bacteriovoracaceae bacterium]|nr:aminoglycoside phosphotransferase family protein [Bacteriovoracaceae bacterium]